jgi:hypothetical protein
MVSVGKDRSLEAWTSGIDEWKYIQPWIFAHNFHENAARQTKQ